MVRTSALFVPLPLLALACGGAGDSAPLIVPAAGVDSAGAAPVGELDLELETLQYEIGDLRAVVGSVAVTPAPSFDPLERLAAADEAREAALDALARGDTVAAVDSIEVAAGRVEDVKRAVGLAEEWGEEIDPAPGGGAPIETRAGERPAAP